jgi:hypothetical protein
VIGKNLPGGVAVLRKRKLDRLARNVHFISGLLESGVDFVAADNPHANKLMVHLLAAFAEHEREQISQRKDALAARNCAGSGLVAMAPNGWHQPIVQRQWREQGSSRRSLPN